VLCGYLNRKWHTCSDGSRGTELQFASYRSGCDLAPPSSPAAEIAGRAHVLCCVFLDSPHVAIINRINDAVAIVPPAVAASGKNLAIGAEAGFKTRFRLKRIGRIGMRAEGVFCAGEGAAGKDRIAY